MFGNREISETYSHQGREFIISIEYKKGDIREIGYAYKFATKDPIFVPELKSLPESFGNMNLLSLFQHAKYFFNLIYDLIKDNRPILLTNNRKLIFIIEEGSSLAYNVKKSDWDIVVLHMSIDALTEYGLYYLITKKLHHSFITDLIHELDHYIDRKVTDFWNKYSDIINRFPNISFKGTFLIQTLILVRAESYPLCLNILSSGQKKVNLIDIYEFRKNLKQIANFKGDSETLQAFIESTYNAEGIHGAAGFIALILCLSDCKKKNLLSECKIRVNGQVFNVINLNNIFKRNSHMIFFDIPKKIIIHTSKRIKEMNYRQLIKGYESACNELNISKKYWIIWHSWFDQLKKQSVDWYKNKNRKFL